MNSAINPKQRSYGRGSYFKIAQLPGHLGAALVVKVTSDQKELVVTRLWFDLEAAGHFEQGAFDDAVVKPSIRKLRKSFDRRASILKLLLPQASWPPSSIAHR
ncbi:hypothetical protein [Ruegeria arenilitoris]|uniref:hypothetical protein n=1 Tax=Ruegeria arenilitoris TaxID=1173585 RepID=UPI00147EC5D4|nr:hypothetical protein [Ruegeria arenilitoris]